MSAFTTNAAETEATHFAVEKGKSSSDSDPLVDYERRIQEFHSAVAEDKGKHNLVFQALKGTVLKEPLEVALKRVKDRQGESDFQIIALVRILFLGDDKIQEIADAKGRIALALDAFPFWPTGEANQPCMDKIIFWSENHLIMTLGSCYLFRQFQLNQDTKNASEAMKNDVLNELNSKLESKLLKVYLRAHCLDVFNGVYEVNSTVYLPYSLSGLLNLYDFALDEEVKRLAKQIIDRIVYHVLLCTTSNGVSNLCAGGRTFVRTRLRTHQHNMNQFVNLLVGVSPDPMYPSAITDFVLTTTWRPNFEEVQQALEFAGTHEALHLSHPTAVTRDIYKSLAGEKDIELGEEELVPFYWSAGLITHPDFVGKSREYLGRKKMLKNEGLSALAQWSAEFLKGRTTNYHTLSTGQCYTGLTLNVYKEPKKQLLLTSFDAYNPHAAGFQQLPWIANVSGVGVWSQAGSGSEGFLNFGMTNTHNPLVTQKGSVLVAVHVAPHSLTSWMFFGSMFSSAVRLFFPLPLMDETCCFQAASDTLFASNTHPPAQSPMVMHTSKAAVDEVVQKSRVWMAGRRGEALIAVLCTRKTKMDYKATKDAEVKVSQESKGVHSPVCCIFLLLCSLLAIFLHQSQVRLLRLMSMLVAWYLFHRELFCLFYF